MVDDEPATAVSADSAERSASSVMSADSAERSASSVMSADSAEKSASSVLLVEDDHELRALLRRLLVGAGYPVDEAADGQAGLHLGLTRDYDVLLLDRGLPALDGVELLRRLRRTRPYRLRR